MQVDDDRNTPLHILLESTSGDVSLEILDVLIGSGANVYARNVNRARPIDFCNCQGDVLEFLCQSENMSLKTIAARAIVDNDVPFRDVLSTKLVEYLEMH